MSRLSLGVLAFFAPLNCVAVPAYRWDFGAEETTKLEEHGGVHRDVPGPRPPEFPDFDANNTAVRLDGNGAHFTFPDLGPSSPLDFTNGDAITLEAWVNLSELPAGAAIVAVGKGRTGSPRFAADNQNWALRLREVGGGARVNFLFSTPRREGRKAVDAHWHRWTSKEGFAPGSGWHHIAVSYRFGTVESMNGWLDGKPLKGFWDMGGATTEAPAVDDDAVWLGASNGGNALNSFRGMIDAVAIHREIVEPDVLAKRFRRTGAEVEVKAAREEMPKLGPIPEGKVQVTFHQGLVAATRWLNEGESWPAETLRWNTERFLLPRFPLLYDAWGIRDVWRGPVLVRMAADVDLSPGRNRLMLRAKGLSRVWVNGVAVMRSNPPFKSPPNGEEPVAPLAVAHLPGLRPAAYGMHESFGDCDVPADGKCHVVLETVVGGKDLRSEPGELCLSVETPDGKSHELLSPVRGVGALPQTDAAIQPELRRLALELENFDTANRQKAAASQDRFWEKRHALAKEWAVAQPAAAVPTGAEHPVDAFLSFKVSKALEGSSQTSLEEARHFHSKVLSILKDECFRCHGDKDKGGLRLNTREAALQGGESGNAALVPGHPDASQLIGRVLSKDEDERMPPKGQGLKPEQIAVLEEWVKSGAPWPKPPVTAADVAPSPRLDDAAFLRRLSLDLTGVGPTQAELADFLADKGANKRELRIDRLLASPQWADSWMPYWMDVLAENPALINPTLNTTGPFRWFLLEALRDNKPMDRFVTELVMLRGSSGTGGSSGFGVAGENDAPFATKGQILASAFLAVELQCARCHDSPYHSSKQADLYGLAAMLERKSVTVPKTSMVPAAFFEKKARESLIKATLKPGELIKPNWPFGETMGVHDDSDLEAFVQNPKDARERLAALLTAPQNTRFAKVFVNRVWRRFIGAGFVEPVADWEGHPSSHPELMDWLAHDFISHGYDLKHLTRTILTAEVYQRAATGSNLAVDPELRFFNAPERRRLSAEQIVDTLHAAAGRPMEIEEITFDPTGRRGEGRHISLGTPTRAWMLANLSNERDRPSLSLPFAQRVVDVLEAFGWSGARQASRTDREGAPNVLQPGVLANGDLSMSLTRATFGSPLAQLAVDATRCEDLVHATFMRFLNRPPSAADALPFVKALQEGFAERLVPEGQVVAPELPPPLPRVTWFNHLRSDATTIALENEKRARRGPPSDPRLREAWREKFEDMVWSLVNTREFVWMP
jgi:mono/diheme cytochrome c family protein